MTIKKEIRDRVLSYFTGDLTLDAVADIMLVSPGSVYNIWKNEYGADACKERRSRLMSGEKHYRWNGGVTYNSKGYRIVYAPDWYEGAVDSAGRTAEHMIKWCEYNGKTKVPDGHIVHHRNEDKLDNSKDNLELMSKSEHLSQHATRRTRDWDGRFV